MLENHANKSIYYRYPKKSFGTYLKTVASNDSRFNLLHLYHQQYPWVLGNRKEFNSIFGDLTRPYGSLNSSVSRFNRPAICTKGLEQALIAYMEYRLHYGV